MVVSAASSVMQLISSNATLAIGPSGSEVEIGQLFFESASNETFGSRSECLVSQFIPVGSRLAVKQNSISSNVDVTLIGIPF